MRITDDQIATFKQQGFLIIENFFTKSEMEDALDGIFTYIGHPYEEWLANGKEIKLPARHYVFPWKHSGLNRIVVHPDLIDAAERIIGTRDIRLCEGSCLPKYYSGGDVGTKPGDFHQDFGNNTMGPLLEEDDFQHILFFVIFDDVLEGMAPIQMVPNGRPIEEAVQMVAPGGSVCIYTPYTRHASSEFRVPGHRFSSWIGYSRKDRLWDGGRGYAYKTGTSLDGMSRFIADATPRQLELIGFPPPGDALWTPSFLAGMQKRYPGFDPAPYQ